MKDILIRSTSCEQIRSDVLVVGGGSAGVSAAVIAARQGLRVGLAERYGFCGGGAFAGLSGSVCGLCLTTGRVGAEPDQIVSGMADEFCAELARRGGLGPPVVYGKTWTLVHETVACRDSADALLADAGVQVVHHAVATGVLMEGGSRLKGAQIRTKQGIETLSADVTIDASGDADVVAMAGLASFAGDHGRVQNPTTIFCMMEVDVAVFLRHYGSDTIMDEEVGALIRRENDAGNYALPRSKIWLFSMTRPGELLRNCARITAIDGRELNRLFHRVFTEAEINGRLQIPEYARFLRDHAVGCADAPIKDSAVQVGVQQTRQAEGVGKLMNEDILAARTYGSSLARSAWPIELHAGTKPRAEWLLDEYHEVPYERFYPSHGEGLLVAGRCLSAEQSRSLSAHHCSVFFIRACGRACRIDCRARSRASTVRRSRFHAQSFA